MSTETTSDGILRAVLIVIGVLILLPLLMMVFAMPMMGMMGWWWSGGGAATGFSPLWGIGMMLVWLVVLLGIGYLIYRGLVGSGEQSAETDSALEELRLAYARGDLSEEEFENRREKLRREG
jgi:putative membrane protein